VATASTTQAGPQLVHEPGRWIVTLRSGDVIDAAAHAYGEVGDSYQFVLLMEGKPPFESEVLRIPRDAVSEIRGG
jgi:hypothetical protein